MFDTERMGQFAELAAELDSRDGSVDRVMWCECREVSAATWQSAGTLDVWIKDKGEWFGRVRDDAGNVRWVPAGDLRPVPDVTNGDRET
jgi:hypothetical protein